MIRKAHEWKKRDFTESLFASLDETTCYLWDFRPVSKQPITELTGRERELYIFCGRGRHRRAIGERAAHYPGTQNEDVDSFLRGMVDRGFFMRDGNVHLSLAISRHHRYP